MAKNIIKEIIIILLLCLAIILAMGVVMYEYNPMAKVIPEEVSYTTPEEVKSELNSVDGVDTSQVIMTYEVNETDLSNYRKINTYSQGKSNPFSTYETIVEETVGSSETSTGGTTTTVVTNTTTGETTTVIEENGSAYTQNTGTK